MKQGEGHDLGSALEDASKKVKGDELGWYRVDKIYISVGNPKINEYKVEIVRGDPTP